MNKAQSTHISEALDTHNACTSEVPSAYDACTSGALSACDAQASGAVHTLIGAPTSHPSGPVANGSQSPQVGNPWFSRAVIFAQDKLVLRFQGDLSQGSGKGSFLQKLCLVPIQVVS